VTEMNKPTREQRKFHRRVQAAMARAYAPGREERMAAAQAKRDRKAEKRALDAKRTIEGQTLVLCRMLSREASPDMEAAPTEATLPCPGSLSPSAPSRRARVPHGNDHDRAGRRSDEP